MGALEAYKNSDIFSSILFLASLQLSQAQSLCVLLRWEATLGDLLISLVGFVASCHRTSQKTISSKQEKRWAPWAIGPLPILMGPRREGGEINTCGKSIEIRCCTDLQLFTYMTPLDVSYVSRKQKVLCSVYRESGLRKLHPSWPSSQRTVKLGLK